MRVHCAEGRLFLLPEDAVSPIRLLALDIDGTLAVRGDEVSSRTREALHEAHARGIALAIATGRRYRTTRRVIDALELPVPAVCLGGALVKSHDHDTLFSQLFTPPDYGLVARTLRESRLTLVAQRDSHSLGGADFIVDDATPWNDPVARYLEVNSEHWEHCDGHADATRDDVLVMGTFGDLGVLEDLTARISDEHVQRFTTSIVPTPWEGSYYLEIMPAHVTKLSGLEQLGERLGMSPVEICAVGDEQNDIPMVEACGLGVAMGNGSDALKARADWVCGRNDEDGLVEVVDHILGDRVGETRTST
jgi:Cof subfamily protein (haloacid dehalogenase superfamily)